MTTEEKQNTLKKIFWDYSFSGHELYSILEKKNDTEYITQEKIFIRMLERLGWHAVLDILGIEKVKLLLKKETIANIRQKELRERYELIQKILFEETVFFTGWGDEYYQKIKHTLFSNRWYCSKQALL